MGSDNSNEDELSELLRRIENGEASTADITLGEQRFREFFHEKKVASSKENLEAVIERKTAEVIAIDDPEEILNLAEHIGNYTVGGRPAPTRRSKPAPARTTKRLSNREHDEIRNNIKQLIYGYYDTHPHAPRTNVTTKNLSRDIPELRKLTGDSEQSLAGYLKPIRKEPDSRIKYEKDTQYTISLAVNYDNVVHAAERVLKRGRFVTKLEIAQELIVEKKHYRSIGRHLARWGSARNLDNEEVSMGKEIGQCVAYFRKDERPPITPTERVQDAVKDLENVTLEHIMNETGLVRRAITTIMTAQHFTQSMTEEGIIYTKQTKG